MSCVTNSTQLDIDWSKIHDEEFNHSNPLNALATVSFACLPISTDKKIRDTSYQQNSTVSDNSNDCNINSSSSTMNYTSISDNKLNYNNSSVHTSTHHTCIPTSPKPNNGNSIINNHNINSNYNTMSNSNNNDHINQNYIATNYSSIQTPNLFSSTHDIKTENTYNNISKSSNNQVYNNMNNSYQNNCNRNYDNVVSEMNMLPNDHQHQHQHQRQYIHNYYHQNQENESTKESSDENNREESQIDRRINIEGREMKREIDDINENIEENDYNLNGSSRQNSISHYETNDSLMAEEEAEKLLHQPYQMKYNNYPNDSYHSKNDTQVMNVNNNNKKYNEFSGYSNSMYKASSISTPNRKYTYQTQSPSFYNTNPKGSNLSKKNMELNTCVSTPPNSIHNTPIHKNNYHYINSSQQNQIPSPRTFSSATSPQCMYSNSFSNLPMSISTSSSTSVDSATITSTTQAISSVQSTPSKVTNINDINNNNINSNINYQNNNNESTTSIDVIHSNMSTPKSKISTPKSKTLNIVNSVKRFDMQPNSPRKNHPTYASLIGQAIMSSPSHRAQLSTICDWIVEHYPTFDRSDQRWQNSIRHNLSLQKCFVKLPHSPSSSSSHSKSCFWTIHSDFVSSFIDGQFVRHRHRRIFKKKDISTISPKDYETKQEKKVNSSIPKKGTNNKIVKGETSSNKSKKKEKKMNIYDSEILNYSQNINNEEIYDKKFNENNINNINNTNISNNNDDEIENTNKYQTLNYPNSKNSKNCQSPTQDMKKNTSDFQMMDVNSNNNSNLNNENENTLNTIDYSNENNISPPIDFTIESNLIRKLNNRNNKNSFDYQMMKNNYELNNGSMMNSDKINHRISSVNLILNNNNENNRTSNSNISTQDINFGSNKNNDFNNNYNNNSSTVLPYSNTMTTTNLITTSTSSTSTPTSTPIATTSTNITPFIINKTREMEIVDHFTLDENINSKNDIVCNEEAEENDNIKNIEIQNFLINHKSKNTPNHKNIYRQNHKSINYLNSECSNINRIENNNDCENNSDNENDDIKNQQNMSSIQNYTNNNTGNIQNSIYSRNLKMLHQAIQIQDENTSVYNGSHQLFQHSSIRNTNSQSN